ncbi:5'/3'-nucleotidase SurE [Aurantivibrio infirmus]
MPPARIDGVTFKPLSFAFAIIVASVFCISAFSTVAFADPARILLTNDDGIESKELATLAALLKNEFDLVISAPRENQSGSSQATNSRSPLRVEKIYQDGDFFGYGVHGKPADAAQFGLMVLGKDKPFDLVVSGINRGSNVGNISHLSGTVGAAMHSQHLGYPSIATSQDGRANTQLTAKVTLDVIKKFLAEGAPLGTVISINVPAGEPKGVVVKTMGGSYFGYRPYEIVSGGGDDITYQSGLLIAPAETNDNDTQAYQEGFITITPLKYDWTDEDKIKSLREWQIALPEDLTNND